MERGTTKRMKKSEKYHLKRRVVQMETILNLCANREVVHEDHTWRNMMCPWQHCGERTTRLVVGKKFYWPKMKYNVKHFMHTYVKCQNMKSIYKKRYGLYRFQLILNEPWENISMDFMTQLPKWNGMDAILMVIDQFSKLAKVVPTKIIITTFDLWNFCSLYGSSITRCYIYHE